MSLPRLLHPIPVQLRKADRTFTAIQDDNLHEPIGQMQRPQVPIKLVAQLSIGPTDRPMPSDGGVTLESDGYMLFRTVDLRNAGIEVERGDRVIQLGEGDNARGVDYYVTYLKPMGHYPRHGGHSLLRAYFEDRQPAQQR